MACLACLATHLLHGELLKNRVILVQPEPAKPVQDPALLWSAGLGLGLGLGLGAGLGVGQGLGLKLGLGLGLGEW